MSEYVLYSKREGWKDLLPIPQADCLNPLVPIAYTEQCKFQVLLLPLSGSSLCHHRYAYNIFLSTKQHSQFYSLDS